MWSLECPCFFRLFWIYIPRSLICSLNIECNFKVDASFLAHVYLYTFAQLLRDWLRFVKGCLTEQWIGLLGFLRSNLLGPDAPAIFWSLEKFNLCRFIFSIPLGNWRRLHCRSVTEGDKAPEGRLPAGTSRAWSPVASRFRPVLCLKAQAQPSMWLLCKAETPTLSYVPVLISDVRFWPIGEGCYKWMFDCLVASAGNEVLLWCLSEVIYWTEWDQLAWRIADFKWYWCAAIWFKYCNRVQSALFHWAWSGSIILSCITPWKFWLLRRNLVSCPSMKQRPDQHSICSCYLWAWQLFPSSTVQILVGFECPEVSLKGFFLHTTEVSEKPQNRSGVG